MGTGGGRGRRACGISGLISSVLLIVGLIAAIIVIALVGLIPGLVLLAVMLPVFLVTLRPDPHGQTPMQRLGMQLGWRRARASRSHLYRSGPLGRTPYGTFQLPGLLAASQLSEARDTYDRPFAVLCHPWCRASDGRARDRAGRRRAGRPAAGRSVGRALRPLARGALPGARTARLPGVGRDRARPGHPAAARDRRAARTRTRPRSRARRSQRSFGSYPAGAADLKARVALTFDMIAAGRRRSATEIAHDLATRLGGITQRLHATGAGVAMPVDAQRLCEIVHAAYNPRAAELLEEARAAGEPAQLRWEDVGPAAADARAESYWHDGAVSVTWAMSQAPRGEVRENVLARLIAPHGDIARKRVTLLYRVIDPGEAARIVERDLHNAEFRVNSAAAPDRTRGGRAAGGARDRAGGSARRGAGELRDARHRNGPRAEQLPRRRGGRRQSRADRPGQPAAGVGLPGLGVRRGATGRAVPARASEGPRADPASAMSPAPAPSTTPASPPGPLLPGPRGWPGRARGRSVYLQPPAEWRATSVQACGLWPFSVGAGAPLIGAPLGKHLLTGATVCGDPISWFQRAGLLTAPTAFVMGLQGFGKSSCIRRMALSLAGFGVLPLVLGDLKPDYVDLIAALDGQVITLGRGRGYLNVLDTDTRPAGRRASSATVSTRKLGRELLADAVGRRHTMVSALISIQRGHPPDDREDSILAAALRVLDERFDGIPVLRDLLEAIESAPDRVRDGGV